MPASSDDRLPGSISIPKKVKGSLSSLETVSGSASVSKRVRGELSNSSEESVLQGVLSATYTISGEISRAESGGSYDVYTGPYTVTPTRETQSLNTRGKIASANITVNPIPNYYGLITWDGSVLTVS